MGFEVKIHRIAAEGDAVLNERTDAMVFGPLRLQFWVCGVVRGARRPNHAVAGLLRPFDFVKAIVRGVVGAVVPVAAAHVVMSRSADAHQAQRCWQYVGYCYGRRLPDSMRDWVPTTWPGRARRSA